MNGRVIAGLCASMVYVDSVERIRRYSKAECRGFGAFRQKCKNERTRLGVNNSTPRLPGVIAIVGLRSKLYVPPTKMNVFCL